MFKGQFVTQNTREFVDKSKLCEAQHAMREKYLQQLSQYRQSNPDFYA